MNRHDYLTQLKRYLKRLPKEDYQDALDYFEEYFDDAGPENEAAAIAALGTPKEAAHDILINLYDKKTQDGESKSSNLIVLVFLSILAAPIGLPMALTLIALLLTGIILLLSLLLVLASVSIALLSMGIASILAAWELATLALNSAALYFGGGLIAIGLSLLVGKGTVLLTHTLMKVCISWIQEKLKGGSRYETA